MTTTTLSKAGIATRERVEHLENRSGRKRVYLVGGILLVGLLFLIFRGMGAPKKQPSPPPPRPVEVAQVTLQDVPLYLDEIGTMSAYQTVQIQPQVTGEIISREFEDGAEVKKGQLLFRIDPRSYEATLAQAQAQLAQAQAQLELNQSNLKRQADLKAKNVGTSQEFDTAKANFAADQARVKAAEAAVAAAQVNLDFTEIRSPIDGRAGLRNVDAGNVVRPGGSTPLVTVQGLDPIYTDFTVAEPDLPLVRRSLDNPHLKVVTDAEGDNIEPRTGDLYFIDNAVQPGAGSVKLRAVTPNPDHALWPAQFVRVRLILDVLENAKLVPTSAVQVGQNGPYVFIVKPDLTLDLRQVTPGQRQGDLTVITEGVEVGESVVVTGQLQLAPGTKVEVKEAQAKAGGREAGGAQAQRSR